MENSPKLESRISILISAYKLKDSSTVENILSTINRSKTDLECILIGVNASLKTTLEGLAAYKELVTKERIKMLDDSENSGVQISNALNIATGYNSIIIEDPEHTIISNVINWAVSNKKNIKPDTFYVGSNAMKGASNKDSQSKKIVRTLLNAAIRFWTPLQLKDNTSGILIANTEWAANAYSNKLSCASDFVQTLHLSACNNIALQEFAINNDKKTPDASLASFFFFPIKALILRWKYFVSSPLKEIKNSNTVALTDGNHPLYRMIFFFFIVFALLSMPYFSQDFGMTWDEKQHNDYSQLSYNYLSSFGEDTAALAEPSSNADYVRQAYRFYGEQMNTIAAIVYNVFSTDPFDTRHAINSLYGFIGLLFCALCVKELFSWRGALIAALFMYGNPSWFGHSMNNPTDIPFATGFAMAGYFMLKVLKNLPRPQNSHLVWLAISLGVGIGSRIAAIMILAYFGLFLGIRWLISFRNKNEKPFSLLVPYLRYFLIVGIIGYFVGILFWPYGLSNPFGSPLKAFAKVSENAFYTNNVELFEGVKLYMIDQAPWYYVFKFIAIANPIYLLVGCAASLLLLFVFRKNAKLGYLLMFQFMILFPLLYAEYKGINYYNGWRHYLFVLPSIVVLSASFYEYIFSVLRKSILQIAFAAFLLIAFAIPSFWMISNHPNEYVYFNELAGGINGAYGNYETDYYSNSCRKAAEWIAKQVPLGQKVTVAINNEPLTASYYAQRINPNIEFMWVRDYEEQKPRWDYLILTSRTFSKNELLNGSFPPKGTVFEVKADQVPLAVVVKRENYFMPDGYTYYDNKNADSAIFFFDKAVQYNPKDEEAYRMLGCSYLNKNSLDTAELYINKSIEIYPENYSAYSNKGTIYLNRNQYDKALEYYNKATYLKRNLTEAHYYASVCEMQKNNYQGAIKHLESALKHNGQIYEVYYNLGVAYLNVGNYNKAEENFGNALTLNPNSAQGYLALGEVYKKMGRQQEYEACMQRYQQLAGR